MTDEHEQCPLEELLRLIGGKWKVIILWWVMDGPLRFSQLRRHLPGVTQKMLTQQLRELEADGMLMRTVYPEVPVRVEYAATERAQTLRPVLQSMQAWSQRHLLDEGR